MEGIRPDGVRFRGEDADAFVIRPYTPKELAARYGCTSKVMRTWLLRLEDELGPRLGRVYSPRQVRIIVARLGEP